MNAPLPRLLLAAALLLCIAAAKTGEVSARRALNGSIPELKFDNTSLADAIDFIADVSGANVHVDWKSLEAIGIGKDATINLRLRSVPLRRVLTMTLNEAAAGNALTFYIADNVIEVTTREEADKQLVTRVYPIDDLIVDVPDFIAPDFQLQTTQTGGGGGSGSNLIGNSSGNNDQAQMTRAERAQALIDTIQATIQPEVWNVNGGKAAIRFFNGSLIVTAPRSVHEALGAPID